MDSRAHYCAEEKEFKGVYVNYHGNQGPALDVNDEFIFEINFCPFCGVDLRKEVAEQAKKPNPPG